MGSVINGFGKGTASEVAEKHQADGIAVEERPFEGRVTLAKSTRASAPVSGNKSQKEACA